MLVCMFCLVLLAASFLSMHWQASFSWRELECHLYSHIVLLTNPHAMLDCKQILWVCGLALFGVFQSLLTLNVFVCTNMWFYCLNLFSGNVHMYVTLPPNMIYVSSWGRLVNEHVRTQGLYGKWAHCHCWAPKCLILPHFFCHSLFHTHPCSPPSPIPPQLSVKSPSICVF